MFDEMISRISNFSFWFGCLGLVIAVITYLFERKRHGQCKSYIKAAMYAVGLILMSYIVLLIKLL